MEKESSYGPAIGLVIIIVIIALGSVYFLQEDNDTEMLETQESSTTIETNIIEVTPEEQEDVVDTINTIGAEDTLDSIESDLNITDLDSIDAGLDDLDF